MRLGHISSVLRKPVLGACALIVGAVAVGGCETKSFINPGEMGRFQHAPLQREILSNLSSGYDEPNEEFPLATDVTAADLKVDSSDYIIGRNDLLQISLTDVTPGVETVKTARVSESGNISLPLIGQVQANGLTEAQLEKLISDKYNQAGIVKNANVSVTVAEARQRTFSIRGAVARPGQYAIVQSEFRVTDALILAGDVSVPQIEYLYVIRPPKPVAPTSQPADQGGNKPVLPGPNPLEPGGAKPNPAGALDTKPSGTPTPGNGPLDLGTGSERPPVFISGNQNVNTAALGPTSRSAAPGTEGDNGKGFEFNNPLPEDQSRIIRVPLRHLINGDLRYNIVIRPQDTITIPAPEQGEYYMGGHVQRVGVYSLTARNITLKQAVISAGMLDEVAIPERTDIIRRIGRDNEVWVRVNLAKVFDGSQPDLFLKPYDTIQVGTNAIAPFLAALRNAFRITYGFGFLYDRNYADPNNLNL